MSIEEQRRKAFENRMKAGFGQYYSLDWDKAEDREKHAWSSALNAALDSVVIELPQSLADDMTLIDSIEAAGLKVKP